jgi:serine/threonine protein kinase/Flp pilus assembly protein TadD
MDPSVESKASATAPITETIEEMAAAWRRGERPRAEEFLARRPDLCEEDAVRLIYEEACLRREAGDVSVSEEICRRFPRWRSKLELLLNCQKWLWAAPPEAADFPEVGQELGDFQLRAELGRGAHGRTFLAIQRSLADRPLVLKVTPLGHDEHLSLARLQHMHIVPLYFEQVLPERNLRVLGMPYLGGTTLDKIEAALAAIPPADRTGRQIALVLERPAVRKDVPGAYPSSGPFRNYLAQASYVHAICWIGACLADALQYAHDRGLVHMDVKPSNVLIAGDGQPMLLDFHLARGPVGPGLDRPDRLGGTPDYASPEQRDAMEAVQKGAAVPAIVDGRSDVYSLALLLYEALGGALRTGQVRVPPARWRPLEDCNPRIAPGLSDIVQKCLAPHAADRYSTAAALAQDLRHHLNDLPLRGVANRSLSERWRKWRRRTPAALGHSLLGLTALAAVSTVVWVVGTQARQRTLQIETTLSQGRDLLGNHRYSEALHEFQRGLDLASSLSDHDERKRALKTHLQEALKEQAAVELRELVNLLRFRYGMSPPTDEEARVLFRRGQEIWKRRHLLWQPGQRRSDPAGGEKIRTDLLDLATILADLRVHSAGIGTVGNEALQVAAQILREASDQLGASPALSRDLHEYEERAGQTVRGASPIVVEPSHPGSPPRTAWEHYDLGRSYLRSGDHARALAEFRQSVELRPGEFWPHFFQGVCAYRLGCYRDSLAALDVCVALMPETAVCYYDRAKVHEALGQPEQAVRDYSRALERNPQFSDAALNRGILAYHAGRNEEAIADFAHARATASGPAARGLIAYNLALVHVARKDWPAARASLSQAIASGNTAARTLARSLGLD